MPDHALRPDFKPTRTERCFCGSGERFKNCCGSRDPDRALPHGIGRVPGFLADDVCARWAEQLEQQPRKRATVLAIGKSNAEQAYSGRADARETGLVQPGDLDGEIKAAFRHALTGPVSSSVGRDFAWFERPEVLRYRQDDHFRPHADNERFDEATGMWLKVLDRDVSMLLYLNEGFEGGTLRFMHFGYEYTPRRGDLVWFPSDHRYLHWAKPVTAGVRWAIACWAAFADEPRVMSHRPSGRTDLDAG